MHHVDVLDNETVLVTDDADDRPLLALVRAIHDLHLASRDKHADSERDREGVLGTLCLVRAVVVSSRSRTMSPRTMCQFGMRSMALDFRRGPRRNASGMRVAMTERASGCLRVCCLPGVGLAAVSAFQFHGTVYRSLAQKWYSGPVQLAATRKSEKRGAEPVSRAPPAPTTKQACAASDSPQ